MQAIQDSIIPFVSELKRNGNMIQSGPLRGEKCTRDERTKEKKKDYGEFSYKDLSKILILIQSFVQTLVPKARFQTRDIQVLALSPNMPVIVYFLESLNSYSMFFVQVL